LKASPKWPEQIYTHNISHRLEIRPGRSLAKQEDRKALKNMVSGGNAYL